MITITRRNIYAADDLEVCVVTMRDGTTHLAGGDLYRLICDPRLYGRIADLTHGVTWVEGGSAHLYVRDLDSMNFLCDSRSLVRSASVPIFLRERFVFWEMDISEDDLQLYAEGKLWAAHDWAEPPPARELALQVKDYVDLSIRLGDECLVRLPNSRGIFDISPEPETLNGCRLHDWATVGQALRAVVDSECVELDRRNVLSIFYVDEDWPPNISVLRYEGCGHRFFAIYHDQYATLVPEELAQGCGYKAQSNPMPGKCPACDKEEK